MVTNENETPAGDNTTPEAAATPAATPAEAAAKPDAETVAQAAKEASAQQSHQAPAPQGQGQSQGQGGGGKPSGFGAPRSDEDSELSEKVVFINRCAKVVKGGRRFSFSALVVSGDHKGKVGFGFGKANEVADCIKKASEDAGRNLEKMSLEGDTIPHETYAEYGGGKVLLKPASPGTGIIAGGGVRAVCEAVGIKDILAKSIGSNNHANVVKATLKALSELRTRDQVLALRGKKKEKSI